MRVLGFSAFHRDSAAALVVDGVPVAAHQEERFTGKLGDWGFPRRSIRACLDEAGISAQDLDRVVFYEKPLRKFERVLAMQLGAFPRSSKTFANGMFLWLGDRLWMKNRILDELEVAGSSVAFVEHQRAHAAAAYFPSPFEEACVLTLDDMGEWATALLARGTGRQLETLSEVHFPHSLGLWYSAFAQYLGFEPGVEEELFEAIAKHGSPRYLDEVRQTLPAGDQGSFGVEPGTFRFAFDAAKLFDAPLVERLGPPRAPGSPLSSGPEDRRAFDLACSVQRVLEERVLELARELHRRAPSRNLCLAGEVARNRSLICCLLAEGPFEQLFVPPAPGEPGAALGAALECACSIAAQERTYVQVAPGFDCAPLPAPEVDGGELGSGALPGFESLEPSRVPAEIAERLLRGERLGWVRGAPELGALSWGRRVLLSSVTSKDALGELLATVQSRVPYAPCRVAVPAERVAELFDTAEVERLAPPALGFAHAELLPLEGRRKDLEHLAAGDGRVWIQAVEAALDPELHAVLSALGSTGYPLAALADLRLRGRPSPRGEADAVEAFQRSTLDALFVENRRYSPTGAAQSTDTPAAHGSGLQKTE